MQYRAWRKIPHRMMCIQSGGGYSGPSSEICQGSGDGDKSPIEQKETPGGGGILKNLEPESEKGNQVANSTLNHGPRMS